MALVTSIVRVNQLLMERIDAVLRPLGLTFARYEVLRLLAFTSGHAMPMSRMGSLLQVHPTSVTSLVERLARQGHVQRVRSADDGRVVLASLTTTGQEVVEAATDALNAEVFQRPGLAPGHVQNLTGLLGALRAHAGDYVHEGDVQGGDVQGGDVQGSDVHGSEVRGADVRADYLHGSATTN